MNLLLFADSKVGGEIANWLMENYSADLGMIVTTAENDIYSKAVVLGIPCCVYQSEEKICNFLGQQPFDLGVLAWWPKIISSRIIALSDNGGRGKDGSIASKAASAWVRSDNLLTFGS